MYTLEEMRTEAGLSRAQVAKAIGCTRQSVFNWDKGRRSPDMETARRLARLYGRSLEEIADAIVHRGTV